MTNRGWPKLLKGGQTLYLERTSINQLAHSRDAPVTNAGDHAWITGHTEVETGRSLLATVRRKWLILANRAPQPAAVTVGAEKPQANEVSLGGLDVTLGAAIEGKMAPDLL